MRFYNYINEMTDKSTEQMKDEIATLRKQIKHIVSVDPKSPQLKQMRKQLADLRMQLKGID